MVKSLSILILIFFGYNISSYAQKYVSIDYTRTHKKYNLEGAEIYFIIEGDSIFLTKTDEYEFRFEPEDISKFELSEDTMIEILVKNCKWVLSFQRQKEIISQYQNFKIRFIKSKRIENVIFGYDNGEWMLTPSEFVRKRRSFNTPKRVRKNREEEYNGD